MNKLPQPCCHFTHEHSTLLDVKQIDKNNACANCSYNGPNLWICLYHKCMQIGCSDQVNDHSTEHFERNKDTNLHCIHMNLSSQRAWCYLCEQEVSIGGVERPAHVIVDPSARGINYLEDEYDSDSSTSGKGTGLVGLQNIANTCYMNSALQALSNVVPMTHYFLHCSDLVDYTLEQASHRCKAGLAKSYQRLMRDIWRKRGEGKASLAPRSILYGIRSVHPMFRGFQQHDTQEFLRCFMDQLHEELKEQSAITDVRFAGYLSKQISSEEQEYEDTPSEMTSSVSSNSLASDYITCESSTSEQSSACEEPITNKPNMMTSASFSASSASTATTTTTNTTTSSAVRSIVSDVFDGKLLSSVQCLTCDRISTREETFQDLSLPIPNRDFLTVLHQTNSISVQSLNSIDSNTSAKINEGWLSWLWNIVRSWLWGPSVTLHDCMASFFSADELKGDNMYSCEKCNKLRTGVKYSRILDLPEVLCIHLKRFRHDLSYSSKISSHVEFPLENFDMRSYIHKDCKSQIQHYNLTSVICHHGTVGGGHYTCFARNALTGRWYEFDDHHVTEVQSEAVQNCQAYVLFYHKYNANMEHIRVKANELAALYPLSQSEIRFYISREWLTRFNTFSEPGPISNWSMLCSHGGILHTKISIISQLAVPISQQLWEFLYRKFGGGPSINMLFECEVCKRAAEALAHRQHYEHSVFQRYNDLEIDSGAIYGISMSWLRKWQQFARGLSHKEPGPINNTSISQLSKDVGQGNSPIRNVRSGSDCVQLNAPAWRFLHDIYGGGPEVLLRPSIPEEIVIIDQDELDESDNQTGNISDTESNLGGLSYNMPESQETNTTESTLIEHDSENEDITSAALQSASKKRQKQKDRSAVKRQIANARLSKKITIAKSRKKKGNQVLFGPQGYYNIKYNDELHSQDDTEQKHQQQLFENDPTYTKENAFIANDGNKFKKSFPNEKRRNLQQLPKPIAAITINSSNTRDVLKIRSLNSKRAKSKNTVVLNNFKALSDTIATDSNETDI